MAAWLLACVVATATGVHAAPATAAAADSLSRGTPGNVEGPGVVTIGPDSTARVRRQAPPRAPKGRFSKPKWVMLRSLVVPGWGQAYNHAWFKSVMVAAGETVLIIGTVRGEQDLRQLQEDLNHAADVGDTGLQDALINKYNATLSQVTTREYLLGAVVLYALADAYVDAHFRGFKYEFETDPALPGGKPSELGVRLGWEWNF